MPCYTKVRTLIVNLDTFLRVVALLGIQPERLKLDNSTFKIGSNQGEVFLTRWGEEGRIPARAFLSLVPIKPDQQQYELQYAPYGIDREVMANAIQLITQEYAMQILEDLATERGLMIAELERNQDGSVHARMVSYGSSQQETIDAQVTLDGTVSAKMQGAGLHAGLGSEPAVKLLQARLGGPILEDNSDHWHDDDSGAALWRNDYDQAG